MSDLKVGDDYYVPKWGHGKVLGFHGGRQGLREWMYILVGLTPTLRVLVPIRQGEVTQ